jgi:anti-sigma factor RsiW
MKCPTAAGRMEVVLDYCAGKLNAGELPVFESHLAGCAECRRAAAAQQAVWTALSAWDEAPVSVDFNRRLYARIQDESQLNGLTRWTRAIAARWTPVSWRPAVPVAAACAALIAVFLIQTPGDRPLQPAPEVARVEKIDVEQVERALDDLDMLKKLGAVSSSTDKTPSSM